MVFLLKFSLGHFLLFVCMLCAGLGSNNEYFYLNTFLEYLYCKIYEVKYLC